MKKFTDIGQYKNVIHDIKHNIDYKGKDENEDAIYLHDKPYPIIKFRGTVKLHGTNSAIVKYKDNTYEFQSRERGSLEPLENDKLSLTKSNTIPSMICVWPICRPMSILKNSHPNKSTAF